MLSIAMRCVNRAHASRNLCYRILISLAVVSCSSASHASDFGVELPTVKKIEILGNRSFDDGTLKKRMSTKETRFYHILRKPKYRRDFLRRDVETIRSFYHRNGFFGARINIEFVEKDEKSNSVRIRLMVVEGPQTVVKNLTFSGQNLIPERDLRKELKLIEGSPYNPNLLETDRYTLFSKFFERGFLGASIVYDVRIDSTDVDLSWQMTTGKAVRIDEVKIAGSRTVDERLIRRELTFKRGEFFNLKKVRESKQNLYDTGYFTSVEIEPQDLDVQRSVVNLLIQMRERKMGYMEVGMGSGNVHGNRVFAEYGKRNVLRRGYALNLKTAHAFSLFPENEYSLSMMDFRSKFLRHEGEFRFPHIFSTWNTFALGAFYERDATIEPAIVKALSFTATVSRRFTRQTSLLMGYAFERVRREGVVEEKEESRRRSLNFTYTRDKRDFYFNPQRGFYVNAEGRYSGGLLGGEDHFYTVVTSVQRYSKISKNTVLAYRVRAGYGNAFGDSKDTGLPIESRFFAGGGNSVRGYRENSLGPQREGAEAIGGRVLLLTNVELRFPFPYLSKYNFGGAVFLDGGNVWRSVQEIKMSYFKLASGVDDTSLLDYRYGTGFGLRYYTPLGPIRLDIGFPLKKTRDVDHDYWIHISLGQIF